jgi:hypothetical protein
MRRWLLAFGAVALAACALLVRRPNQPPVERAAAPAEAVAPVATGLPAPGRPSAPSSSPARRRALLPSRPPPAGATIGRPPSEADPDAPEPALPPGQTELRDHRAEKSAVPPSPISNATLATARTLLEQAVAPCFSDRSAILLRFTLVTVSGRARVVDPEVLGAGTDAEGLACAARASAEVSWASTDADANQTVTAPLALH